MIIILNDFITKEEEKFLLSKLKPSMVVSGEGRNRVYRYGSNIPYKGSKSEDIPDWLFRIKLRISDEWRKIGYEAIPDHVTINEYCKGQSIDWHIDSKGSGPVITVLSLESKALMGLRYPDKSGPEHIQPIQRLPERSLCHMTEEDRWNKEHCILPVEDHRWSIVFRKGTYE